MNNRNFEFARLFSKEWVCHADGGSGSWLYSRNTDVPSENRIGLFQFIEVTDMDEACGRDNEGQPKYVCELSEVFLPECPVDAARSFCGWPWDGHTKQEGEQPLPLADAEMCHSYGAKAPLGSWEGNGIDRLLRAARKEANSLDARNGVNILRAMKLNMPVNRIGTSALDYMRGNLIQSPNVLGPNACTVKSEDILRYTPK
jgi:hypothetical protein